MNSSGERIINQAVNIDYNKTKEFFKKRSEVYDKNNEYSTTMYQDNNLDLVKSRHEAEKKHILPKLKLNNKCDLIDIGCGIGRWADILKRQRIRSYLGIDFSEELLSIAKARINENSFRFERFSAVDVDKVNYKRFNRVIISAVLMYMNDDDVYKTLMNILKIVTINKHCLIYIREPIAIEDRMTLKNFYSKEMELEYNAIYRKREEYNKFLNATLLKNGFKILEENFLFDESLSNRKETRQYYLVLARD